MAESRNRQFERRFRYYEVLEVDRDATLVEIKQAYRRLAWKYHPDRNPAAEAQEKFKKINEAYEVLSNSTRRYSYDNSPAECPLCWTHEVIQTSGIYWRCRHCGCKFNPAKVSEVIEQVEKAAIPEKRRELLKIFQTTQCSWCSRFFTQPFLCPYGKLQSSCVSFNRISDEERKQYLGDEKWWWRMVDMIERVQNKGMLGKCRNCGAMNPNPQKTLCWRCGENSLCCPKCLGNLILRYHIKGDYWKCPNAAHGAKFQIMPKARRPEPALSEEVCPNCDEKLFYDALSNLWRCKNCKYVYTHDDLKYRKEEYKKAKSSRRWHAKAGGYTTYEKDEYSEFKCTYEPPSSTYSEPKHDRISLTAIPLILAVSAGLAIILYTLRHSDQIGLPLAIGIIITAISMTIWNSVKLGWLWKYRPRRATAKRIVSSLILVALIGCIAGAFTGIAPLSNVKENALNSLTGFYQGSTAVTPPAEEVSEAGSENGVTQKSETTKPSTALTEPPPVQHGQLVEYALELINEDRKDNRLSPVILGNNTAAQEHAEEMLANDYISHWGMDGMKPYMRYTLAGGFNYEAENAFMTRTIWISGKDPTYTRDPKEMLDEAEESLMDSPYHRTTILGKRHEKVNVGLAYDKERLALVQQFEGDCIEFSQSPALEDGLLSVSGEALEGFIVEQIHIWYDPLPHTLTLGQLGMTYAYGFGEPAAFIRPPPPPRHYYEESVCLFTWETCLDPYSVPLDTPTPEPSSFLVQIAPPPIIATARVKWVDADYWDVGGGSFAIEADLSDIISEFGEGVYTVIIWANIGEKSQYLTNYSIFMQ